jgi:hypothetical protein
MTISPSGTILGSSCGPILRLRFYSVLRSDVTVAARTPRADITYDLRTQRHRAKIATRVGS